MKHDSPPEAQRTPEKMNTAAQRTPDRTSTEAHGTPDQANTAADRAPETINTVAHRILETKKRVPDEPKSPPPAFSDSEIELDGFPTSSREDIDGNRDPIELLASEFAERIRGGENPTIDEYLDRYPKFAPEIRELFPMVAAMEHWKVRKETDCLQRQLAHDLAVERLGKYRITGEIGRGGMGVVFEGVPDTGAGRVAIKMLPWRSFNTSHAQRRFELEAQHASRLQHRNIVPVVDFGVHDGYSYYVMQYIEGVGLDWVIRQLQGREGVVFAEEIARMRSENTDASSSASAVEKRSASQGRKSTGDTDEPPTHAIRTSLQHRSLQRESWKKFAKIGLQVADALRYAHRMGTVHRDIKPANLLLDSQGRVWVTDFGLAEAIVPDSNTPQHGMAGTLRYMSPEQLEGRFDKRSDIYALGMTLYELLTLRPAYDSSNRLALIDQIQAGQLVPPRQLSPNCPQDLETIVLKALARDPEQRYQSAGELAADLRHFLNDHPIHASRPSLLARFFKRFRGDGS